MAAGGEQRKSQPGPLWGTASRKRGRSGFYFSQQLRSSLTQHRLPSAVDPALPRFEAPPPLRVGPHRSPARPRRSRGVRTQIPPGRPRPCCDPRPAWARSRVDARGSAGRRSPRDPLPAAALNRHGTPSCAEPCPHLTWRPLSLTPRGLRPARRKGRAAAAGLEAARPGCGLLAAGPADPRSSRRGSLLSRRAAAAAAAVLCTATAALSLHQLTACHCLICP